MSVFDAKKSQLLPENIKHIIWIQTAFIGDVILTSGAMWLLKRKYPHIEQHIITTGAGAAALKGLGCLSSVLIFDKSAGFFGELKRAGDFFSQLPTAGTVILKPHLSMRSSLLAKWLGYPTLTFREASGAFLATCAVPRVIVFHEAVRIALLLEPLGVAREDVLQARPRLDGDFSEAISQNDWWTALVEVVEQGRKLVGLAPGSIWATKRWPVEFFVQLGIRLTEEYGVVLVLMGSKDELGLCQQIEEGVRAHHNQNSWVHNLSGKTGLGELPQVFAKFSLAVVNDSAPLHFASAGNVPTLAIFGATIPEFGFGPLSQCHAVMENKSLPCRPCHVHGPMKCPLEHFKCMKDLTVAKVFQAACELLGDV